MAIIVSEDRYSKIELDLNGPDGNVFCVIGTAVNVAKQIGYSTEELKEFRTKCMSQSYGKTLVDVDRLFGDFIDLKMTSSYMRSIDDSSFKLYFLKQ